MGSVRLFPTVGVGVHDLPARGPGDAHVIRNKAEAAYRRGDLFDKRRDMMADWERYCSTVVPGKVTSIKKKVAS